MAQTPSAPRKATTSKATSKPAKKQTSAAGAQEGDGRKTFVLDTSVLLSAPNALFQFAEHEVVIPLVVVTELEAKRTHDFLGFPAREALRHLERLRETGNIREGVSVNEFGGIVRIEINHVDQAGMPDAMIRDNSNDTRILAVAKNLATGINGEPGRDVTVVSKDLPMRLKADALGLGADEYRNEQVVVTRAYTGIEEVEVDWDVPGALYEEKELDIDESLLDVDGNPILTNSGVIVYSGNQSALATVTPSKTLKLVRSDREVFGIVGRSAEQRIVIDHLMNPDIGVVSIGGQAGSGKSSLALAAGLEQVLETNTYKKVTVFRPLYAVGGQELGYLPGSAEEKMAPWAAAVMDALGAMVSKEVIEEIVARELLEILPLTHIRGRSLHDAFVIVDEAQSLERSVLVTAMTRIGQNAKIVLTHDVSQRDNLRVGRYDGVAAIIERLKGEPLFAHVTLSKSERSAVAEMANRLLDWGQ